jgi:dGTPase
MERLEVLPEEWLEEVALARQEGGDRTRPEAKQALARVVLDYVAGMTDRFAIQEYERLIGRAL